MKKPDSTFRVLIVEDESHLRHALAMKFVHQGYDVITASNGEEGLHTALQHQPDIILLDILMPIMDGVEMLKMLRENPWGANVPVLMLTNSTDSDKIDRSMNYGATQYLVKADWPLEKLIVKVKETLERPSVSQ